MEYHEMVEQEQRGVNVWEAMRKVAGWQQHHHHVGECSSGATHIERRVES